MDLSSSRILAGKTVIVAGVGAGLGGHIVRNASASGASVMMAARSPEYGEALAAELNQAGGRIAFRVCDVTSTDECAQLIETCVSEFGAVDAVVANAAASGSRATLEHGSLDDWREAFEVNLFGSLGLVKAAIPALRESGHGSVVFIGSQIVRRVFPGRGAYASSKAALLTAAQVLAKELGPDGIRVNTVVPGRMWGPSLQSAIPLLSAERGTTEDEQVASWLAATSMNRLATDEECARAVIFLVSELSAAMTGQSVDTNAGETMH